MFVDVWKRGLRQINAATHRTQMPLRRLIQRKAATRHAAYIGRSIHTPGAAMNKILVVVYSYTGTSRRVADLLCSQQGWPMAEIVATRPRAGVLGNLQCLLDSVFRRHPPIRYEGPHTRDFDAVVLVSPIWGERLAGPMRSFVRTRRNHMPDVAVVSVMGGHGAPNAVAEISHLIGRSPILDAAFTTREVESGSFATRLEAFGTAVRKAEGAQSTVRPADLSPQAV
jgi:hypothetical protein